MKILCLKNGIKDFKVIFLTSISQKKTRQKFTIFNLKKMSKTDLNRCSSFSNIFENLFIDRDICIILE